MNANFIYDFPSHIEKECEILRNKDYYLEHMLLTLGATFLSLTGKKLLSTLLKRRIALGP